MKKLTIFILVLMTGFSPLFSIAQKKELNELQTAKISNLELSYFQKIKKNKADTSYFVTVVITDVHPITSKLLTFGGKTREFSFGNEKDFYNYQNQLKQALASIDSKSKSSFRGSGANTTLETEFDKENNRHRLKLTWNTIGTLEGRYTYLYLQDLYKMVEWFSTINFGKEKALPPTSPQILTSLTEEIALAPSIEKQYKSDVLQGGTNNGQLTTITGKWYNLMMRNEFKNGGVESGTTGDYEPIKISGDGTWSYYGKRGKISIVPFTITDVLEWKMNKEIPKWKLIFQDFSNGDGVGYFTTDAVGNAVYVVVKFKIYSPREGYSIWTQYRKS